MPPPPQVSRQGRAGHGSTVTHMSQSGSTSSPHIRELKAQCAMCEVQEATM